MTCHRALADPGGDLHDFSPEANQADVDARRGLPLADVIAELEKAYELGAAGPQIHRVALGEWVHGGDIREALGEPDAYASAGVDDALTILVQRGVTREVPPTDVHLTDGRSRRLGDPDANADGVLRTDVAGLVRIVANRRPELAEADLTGLIPSELRMFF